MLQDYHYHILAPFFFSLRFPNRLQIKQKIKKREVFLIAGRRFFWFYLEQFVAFFFFSFLIFFSKTERESERKQIKKPEELKTKSEERRNEGETTG